MWAEHTLLALLLVQTGMEDVGAAEERSGELPHHKLNDRANFAEKPFSHHHKQCPVWWTKLPWKRE